MNPLVVCFSFPRRGRCLKKNPRPTSLTRALPELPEFFYFFRVREKRPERLYKIFFWFFSAFRLAQVSKLGEGDSGKAGRSPGVHRCSRVRRFQAFGNTLGLFRLSPQRVRTLFFGSRPNTYCRKPSRGKVAPKNGFSPLFDLFVQAEPVRPIDRPPLRLRPIHLRLMGKPGLRTLRQIPLLKTW